MVLIWNLDDHISAFPWWQSLQVIYELHYDGCDGKPRLDSLWVLQAVVFMAVFL